MKQTYPDARTEFICTEYLYHRICLRCGVAEHHKPGYAPACSNCGCDCLWVTRVASPDQPGTVMEQFLDPDCPTCQQTARKLHSFDTPQLELFPVV